MIHGSVSVFLHEVLHEEEELLGLVHRPEVHVLAALAVDDHAHLHSVELDQVLGEPADLEVFLPQLHNHLLLALIEQQDVLVDREVETDGQVLSLGLLQLALEALVLQDVDQLQGVADALLLVSEVDEWLEGGSQLVRLAPEGDEVSVLIVQHRGKGTVPGRHTLKLHPELKQTLGRLGFIVDTGKFVMELNNILLQLLADLSLFLQQVLPGLEDLVAPLDEQLVSGLELINQHDFILKEVVIVCDLLVELDLLLPRRLDIIGKDLHFLLLILGRITVHIVYGLEGGKQYLFNPVRKHLQVLDLSVVQLCQLEGHLLEGLVDEVLLGFLGEVEL